MQFNTVQEKLTKFFLFYVGILCSKHVMQVRKHKCLAYLEKKDTCSVNIPDEVINLSLAI